MTTNQIKKRRCSKKLFLDIPQRVIVHKILILHELYINLKEEKNPFMLFGYFLNDRLRNIWFIFPSIVCYGENYHKGILNGNLIINYSKLCNIHFNEVTVPNIVKFSHRMYSLRSIVCSNTNDFSSLPEKSLPEGFFSKSKFPKLKRFSLKSADSTRVTIEGNWHECEFFDQLKSLHLYIRPHINSQLDLVSFFRTKENIFGKNMKKLILNRIELEEKVIISLPNLEILELDNCENLFVIPSEKKSNRIILVLDSSPEIDQIALNSRNAEIIEVDDCCGNFLPIFEKEEFPNLKELKISFIDYTINNKWTFSSRLQYLEIFLNFSNPHFFQNNEWDELVQLKVEYSQSFEIKDVKFPNLLYLTITDCDGIDDEFFEQFEGNVLLQLGLDLLDSCKLTGKNWNSNIFKNLEELSFRNEFDDSFFQDNEFPNLKKMTVFHNSSLKDRSSWKEMKSLEEIEAYECKFIKEWKKK